ncbi:MAG: hypothetical protein J7L20_03760 [Thermoplasmata archaeon]|nr:hypothetical protein [Thermoplasmata archaeon]
MTEIMSVNEMEKLVSSWKRELEEIVKKMGEIAKQMAAKEESFPYSIRQQLPEVITDLSDAGACVNYALTGLSEIKKTIEDFEKAFSKKS